MGKKAPFEAPFLPTELSAFCPCTGEDKSQNLNLSPRVVAEIIRSFKQL